MASVTQRISEIKQPRGGFIKPSAFEKIEYNDGYEMENGNISPIIVGLAVDYLSRFMMLVKKGNNDLISIRKKSFEISIKGYKNKKQCVSRDEIKNDEKLGLDIESLLENVKGLDDESIISACKATTYDVWYRNPLMSEGAKKAIDTNPNEETIENIRVMVKRSLTFFEKYGPIVKDGFTFDGGYSKTVDAGDGDFLTKDTLWDFKVSKNNLTSKHTLQLLMYWIMGRHSKQSIFNSIEKIGVYNPRKNVVYLYDMNKLDHDVIEFVEKNIICYKK